MNASSATLARPAAPGVESAPAITYEFRVITEAEAAPRFVDVVRQTWRQTLALVAVAVVAGQFLVMPLVQQRTQASLGRELQERFAVAAGAIGLSDLSPLPNEPVALGTPIAMLSIPALGVEQVVVEGAAASQTQGGPGHVAGTAGIGERGVSIIAGHRTTAGAPFANVDALKVGDTISTVTVAGPMSYKVTAIGTKVPDVRATTGNRSVLVLATGAPVGLALSDVVVVAESTSPAYPSTPQNRLADGGLRSAHSAAAVPVIVLVALLLLAISLARFWFRSGLMDRLLVWTLASPVVLLVGFLLARAVAGLLPATL